MASDTSLTPVVCSALALATSSILWTTAPTSALDLRHQLEVLTRIRATMMARDSIGVVALHDLNLAARFADHLILLGQGRILAQGSAETVLRSPAISETYKVEVETSTGPRQDLTVHAYAS